MIVTVLYSRVPGGRGSGCKRFVWLNYFFPGTLRSTSQSHKCSRSVVFSRTFVCKNCWIFVHCLWPPSDSSSEFYSVTSENSAQAILQTDYEKREPTALCFYTVLFWTSPVQYYPRIRSELSEWLIDPIALTKPSCASESESILCSLQSRTSCCVVLCCVVLCAEDRGRITCSTEGTRRPAVAQVLVSSAEAKHWALVL